MPLNQLQFLKRSFEQKDGFVIAPLLKRSIESPFVWTQNLNSEIIIWRGLVEQQLFEAVLHGEEYYEQFRKKLMKCEDEYLLSKIASMLSVPYAIVWNKYTSRFLGYMDHLDVN